jgi:hypothetical protein
MSCLLMTHFGHPSDVPTYSFGELFFMPDKISSGVNGSIILTFRSGERLALITVCHPFGEEIDARLRPGTFASRRRRWHDSPAYAANAVEDHRRVGLHVIVVCKVERLAHPLNIPLHSGRISAAKLVSLLIVPPCSRQSTSKTL